MFERFSAEARHVVVLAQEEARQLDHNYIGTEHILLGLLAEREGIACHVLEGFGMSLEGARQEVINVVGAGKHAPTGRIPFTPRAKKILELALREALQLHHNYIGTEHILLGVIREGDGVAALIIQKSASLPEIRTALLERVPAGKAETATRARRWLRRAGSDTGESSPAADPPSEQAVLTATPAADATLSEAARLAAGQPVGSHHLLLAALADTESAAARALAAMGVNLEQARDALREIDVTGTSDEQPEVAGRRQMVIHVAEDRLTVEATDPVIVAAGKAALRALGEEAVSAGAIRGDLAASASLSTVWQALRDSLATIQRNPAPPAAA